MKEKKNRQGEGGGPPKKYTQDFIEKEADLLVEWSKKEDSLFLRDFAYERGYNPNRLQEFAKENKKFAGALEQAKDNQERRLLSAAMKKEVDMTWLKYALPRLLQDRPYLKASWDSQEQQTVVQTPSVTINKIVKSDE